LIPFEATLPSTTINRFCVTCDTVADPRADLKRLLDAPDAPERDADYQRLTEEEREDLMTSIMAQGDVLQYRYSLNLTPRRVGLLVDFVTNHFLDIAAAAEELDKVYDAVESCSLSFFEKFGLTVEFTEGAADEMVRRVLIEGRSAEKVCEIFTRDFEYGLKLIKEKTGRSRFVIDRDAISEPETYLNDLITDLFQVEE
jgi:ATP-dependent Clp protease ATP-binding subunit ClpX